MTPLPWLALTGSALPTWPSSPTFHCLGHHHEKIPQNYLIEEEATFALWYWCGIDWGSESVQPDPCRLSAIPLSRWVRDSVRRCDPHRSRVSFNLIASQLTNVKQKTVSCLFMDCMATGGKPGPRTTYVGLRTFCRKKNRCLRFVSSHMDMMPTSSTPKYL
jgi:hypothetical protein